MKNTLSLVAALALVACSGAPAGVDDPTTDTTTEPDRAVVAPPRSHAALVEEPTPLDEDPPDVVNCKHAAPGERHALGCLTATP